jgi:hypothetical protein
LICAARLPGFFLEWSWQIPAEELTLLHPEMGRSDWISNVENLPGTVAEEAHWTPKKPAMPEIW